MVVRREKGDAIALMSDRSQKALLIWLLIIQQNAEFFFFCSFAET